MTFRDRRSYASVLVDDTNRKPVCRLHFYGRNKHVGRFDERKVETRRQIQSVDDIFNVASLLRQTAKRYR